MDGKNASLIKKPLRKLRGLLFLSRFCICIAALLSTSSIKPAFSQERKINIAYAGPSLIALPFLAAQEWKLFSQNGLSTQLIVMTFTISIPALSAEQESKAFAISPFTGVSDMVQALESGYLSAAMLQPPQLFYAMGKGFKEILNVASMIEMPVGGLTTLVKTIKSRPEEVKAVIKSVQQTKQRMLKSKEETIGLIMKVGKTDREAAL